MELPSKQTIRTNSFQYRTKIEDHMLIVMVLYTHKKNLSQPIETFVKQYRTAVTVPAGYNGIFNVTSKNSNFCFNIDYSRWFLLINKSI